MKVTRPFSLIKTVMTSLPEEEVIVAVQETLTSRYLQLKLDPFLYANGSVPRGAHRSEELSPDRQLRVEIYQIIGSATPTQVLGFLERRGALHLGGLGLILIERVLPFGLSCMAFEEDNFDNVTSLLRVIEGEYQFMIMKPGVILDPSDGFVCITEYSDFE